MLLSSLMFVDVVVVGDVVACFVSIQTV